MADHFYGVATRQLAYSTTSLDTTVGTSSTAGLPIELRVTDAAVTAEDVYAFLERMASWFATKDQRVIPAGTLL